MKIIKRDALTIALTLAVLISIGLSVILCSNPSYEHTRRSRSNSYRSSLIKKPLADVYMPNQAIHTDENGHQDLMTDPMANIMSEVRKRLVRCRYGRLRKVSHASRPRYFKYLNRRRSLVLDYQNNITSNLFNRVLAHRIKTGPDHQFSRIVLPLNRHHFIYLLRDSGYAVYRIDVTNHRLTGLNRLLERPLNRIPVKILTGHSRPMVDYPKSISLPQYEYLINRQSRDYYIMHLLTNSQRITRTRHRNYVAYGNNSNRRLMFDPYQNVTYVDDHPNGVHGDYDRMLMNSYHHLMNLTVPLNGVHYFAYRPQTRQVTYRGFIEGFPIFNTTQLGAIDLNYSGANLRYRYSLDSLQIPVPSDRHRVKLPPTRQVLKTLKQDGYHLDGVQAIEIGYRWQQAKSSKLLANLIPNWFIEYHHHWINYDQLRSNSAAND